MTKDDLISIVEHYVPKKQDRDSVLSAVWDYSEAIIAAKPHVRHRAGNYIMIPKDDKILIQSAEYIEDGTYIEVDGNIITLFEIPMFGGEVQKIGQFNSIKEAILYSETLT